MTILSDEALEFAKKHLIAYYDSDFFPKPESLAALWGEWVSVKSHLTGRNVAKLPLRLPRTLAAPKKGGGFRVVHQLDPLDAIAYTALAFQVAEDVERARIPPASGSVFSYRIRMSDKTFFAAENGYPDFIARCSELSKSYSWVLVADLADFYNRLYVHRVENALASANPASQRLAKDIEDFLLTLNGKASQGIPVGPAASIVLSEAVLSDIDQQLLTRGCVFARYVDDIRIFADSDDELVELQEDLSQYLYEVHRLQFNWEKTGLMPTEHFAQTVLTSPHLVEAEELLGAVRVACAYGDLYSADDLAELTKRFFASSGGTDDRIKVEEVDEDDFVDLNEVESKLEQRENRTVRMHVLTKLFEKGVSPGSLDLGMVRTALRRSRQFKNTSLVSLIFAKFDLLGPVLPDVFLYLDAVIDEPMVDEVSADCIALFDSRLFRTSRFARFWTFWFLSSRAGLVSKAKISRRIWTEASIEHQARAAMTTKNVSWVRGKKAVIGTLGPWDQRAVLQASTLLPISERKPWLQSVSGTLGDSERIVCSWAISQ